MRVGQRNFSLALSLAMLLATIGAAACGPTQPSPSSSSLASAATELAPSAPPGSSQADPTASSTVTPPSPPPAATVDPGLLEVLPTEIDGVVLEPDPTTAAGVASDPLLAESALGIAVALAVAAGTSGPDDLAVASVIRLRPDVFDEAFFQEWRDTYNEAACEVADGIESESEREIAGRAAYLASCTGGAQTYHVHLEDQGFIVSVTATGERRFGELIIAGLAG